MIKKRFNNSFSKAFSLIELSIVILIIGIIIAGITQSSRLVKQFKLSTARTLTQSSPVSSIKDLATWYETTSVASIDEIEAEDSAITTTPVSTWHDINPESAYKHNATGTLTTRPLYYANCINSLPCLRFDGIDDYLGFDGTTLVGVDYTIFVVEQRRTAIAKYFLGSSATVNNTSLDLGYSADGIVSFSQGDVGNNYTVGTSPAIGTYSAPIAHLHSFVNSTIASGTPTFDHYLNGSSTASVKAAVGTPAMGSLTAYAAAKVGSSADGTFNGDIGEIIVFTRALKSEERAAVEAYLLKKWGIAKAN